eukprot:470780-Rhodomonas_salina.1
MPKPHKPGTNCAAKAFDSARPLAGDRGIRVPGDGEDDEEDDKRDHIRDQEEPAVHLEARTHR